MDTNTIVTPEELELLGVASALLELIGDRATSAAWGAGTTWKDKPTAQALGRLAGVATLAADTTFDVANIAQNYVDIEDAVDVFNRAAGSYRRLLSGDSESPGHSVKV